MGKTAKTSTKKSLEKDYSKILKTGVPFPTTNPQWIAQGDYFAKFSLYQNTPTIASDNTVTRQDS
jgi:hypothetical protein